MQHVWKTVPSLKRTSLSALLPSHLSFPAHNCSILNKLDPVTAAEVHKLLSSSLPKSSNMDVIPTSLVLRCQSVFSEIIACLANLSFSEGRFPGKFKQVSVTPLLKGRSLDKSLPSNYRPISDLNSLVLRCQSVFSEIIACLANLSFSEGRFPGKFKQASVTPLLKGRSLDKSLPSNYRPISNLNFISKVLERLFLFYLISSLTSWALQILINTSLHIGQAVPLSWQRTGRDPAATRYLSTEGDDVYSSQKGLVQDLTVPQGPLWTVW